MSRRDGDWLFDLGNSRLKLAPLDRDGRVGEVAAHAHDAIDWCSRLPSGRRAWVCSVASPVRSLELLQGLAQRFERVSIARTPAALGGVRVAYAQPGRLGVDRFLAMLGARALGNGPWLLVGVGTALVIDLLGSDGAHVGGRIAPSPTVMREALHARAAQLPAGGGHYAEFAVDTDDALASGCDGAARALVERSLAEARRRLGEPAVALLHGGGAAAFAPLLDAARVEPSLVLQGLAAWASAVAMRG